MSKESLSLKSGAQAYIEPKSITVAENSTLLLGSPTYVFPAMYPAGPQIERDVFVGVVIGSDGIGTGIPSPIPGAELSGFSAVDNNDGTWSVGFVVLQSGTRFPADEIAREIGYGLLGGKGWRVVETEPVPDGIMLNPRRASRLGRRDGTLFWALATRAIGGDAGVAILRRTGDGWQLNLESPSRVHGLATAHMPTLGDLVAVARPDTVSQTQRGTLMIESIDQGDGLGSFVIDAGRGNIRSPVFDSVEDPRWIGWLSDVQDEQGARTEARAAPVNPRVPGRTVIVLDPNSMGLQPLGALGPGASYWVSDHVGQDRSILVLRIVDSRSEVIFRMPNPYNAPFAAVAMSPSEILLSGPVPSSEEGVPPVTTVLIRLNRKCEAGIE